MIQGREARHGRAIGTLFERGRLSIQARSGNRASFNQFGTIRTPHLHLVVPDHKRIDAATGYGFPKEASPAITRRPVRVSSTAPRRVAGHNRSRLPLNSPTDALAETRSCCFPYRLSKSPHSATTYAWQRNRLLFSGAIAYCESRGV